MSDETMDRCPACNAELSADSEHCPECGSVLSESSTRSTEDVLGFSVVQGSGFQEDEYIPSPPMPADQPESEISQPASVPTESQSQGGAGDRAQDDAGGGMELDSLVDPNQLAAAADAADGMEGGLELESMIPTAASPPPEAPTADADLDIDLDMVDEAAAPPKTRPAAAPVNAPRPRKPAPTPPRQPETRPAKTRSESSSPTPKKAAARSRSSVGFPGMLVRVVLVIVVAGAAWVFAGAPGGDRVRALGIPVPQFGGPEGIRYVNNMLVDPVKIMVDDSLYAVLQPGARQAVPLSAGGVLTWALERPAQPGGVGAGEVISSVMPEPMVAGSDEHYRINNQSAEYWIFAPLITNPTGRDMVAIVNAGTGRARPCNCVIPAGARDYHIGYYGLESGLDIRFFDAETGYEGRYREARDVAGTIVANSGAVNVRIPRR